MPSTFNPAILEETIIDTEIATSLEPVPEGEYEALIDDYTFRDIIETKFGERAPLDIYWMIPDEKLKKELHRDIVTVKQGLLLELNEDNSLATGPGQNAQLGRLLAALGMNAKGFSFPALRGAGPARVLVSHRVVGEDTYSEVKKVVPMA